MSRTKTSSKASPLHRIDQSCISTDWSDSVLYNQCLCGRGYGVRVLAVPELLSTIDLFLAGRLDAAGLEEWAEQREMSEDIEYDEADEVAIAESAPVAG